MPKLILLTKMTKRLLLNSFKNILNKNKDKNYLKLQVSPPPPIKRHLNINPATNSRRGEVMLHSTSVYEAWNGYGRVWTKICCNPGSEQLQKMCKMSTDYVNDIYNFTVKGMILSAINATKIILKMI